MISVINDGLNLREGLTYFPDELISRMVLFEQQLSITGDIYSTQLLQ